MADRGAESEQKQTGSPTQQQMDRIANDLSEHPEFLDMTLGQILAYYRIIDAAEDREDRESPYARPAVSKPSKFPFRRR